MLVERVGWKRTVEMEEVLVVRTWCAGVGSSYRSRAEVERRDWEVKPSREHRSSRERAKVVVPSAVVAAPGLLLERGARRGGRRSWNDSPMMSLDCRR